MANFNSGTRRKSRMKSKTAKVVLGTNYRDRHKACDENALYYEQYKVYGRYAAQEELDIDRAIKHLDIMIAGASGR